MPYVRISDGHAFEDLAAAIENFKCPGPCGPECPLFERRSLPSVPGMTGHLCHPDYYRHHPRKVAAILDLSKT